MFDVDREMDLCDMMRDPYTDPYEREGGYNQSGTGPSDPDSYDGFISSQQLGIALGLAEMIAEENASTIDPATVLEDFQESLEKISLKTRHKDKVPVPAFEQYVYKKCGIM